LSTASRKELRGRRMICLFKMTDSFDKAGVQGLIVRRCPAAFKDVASCVGGVIVMVLDNQCIYDVAIRTVDGAYLLPYQR
jgi:hypothetical protein